MMNEFDEHVRLVKDKFRVSEVREHQRNVLEAVYNGKDVFFMAPTGSGKSLSYEIFPILSDLRTGKSDSMVIVVSPLTALIDSQIEKLKACGLCAIHLTSEVESIPPQCKYLFASPETLLTTNRHQLLTPRVQNSLVGFFIDEGHCIIKWGKNDAKTKKAFRGHYARLGEVRSLLPASVPLVVMTATATAAARRDIVKLTGMHNYAEVVLSPNRRNIRYSVVHLPKFDLYAAFKHIIDDIEDNNTSAERVIVYCRKKEHCSDLFELFSTTLGEKGFANGTFGDDRTRMYAMFHSKTQDDVKSSVLKSFSEENGHVRVVFCTVAFGMGIDVKGTYCVVHVGPSNSIEDYLQESGRAGRDGKSQSHAVLITYPRCTSGNVSDEMKDYCKNTDCRRKRLLEPFNFVEDYSDMGHKCCDLCSSSCDCLDCYQCTSSLEKSLRTMLSTESAENIIHHVTPSQKLDMQSKLLDYRNTLVDERTLFHGIDISTGFTRALIHDVVKNVGIVSGPDILKEKFNFICQEHVIETWNILCEILENDSLSDSESVGSSSDSDTETITKHFRRRPLILSSDSE
ncbi:uncharacterized protein LOC132718053 [Ruditapes philippinarum]|uniref:uncharacterized protein LOC132718053 n=1 Tax=Ruditapes philippinarum TaxID=129788 RepID=UPI00295BDACE|nr:uncharacterized protein LOC132718053 [Ruditapes philippinarum]